MVTTEGGLFITFDVDREAMEAIARDVAAELSAEYSAALESRVRSIVLDIMRERELRVVGEI